MVPRWVAGLGVRLRGSTPRPFAGIQPLRYKAERMAEYITKSHSRRLLLLMKKIPLSRNWHSRRRSLNLGGLGGSASISISH
jgi:hypothetical protein